MIYVSKFDNLPDFSKAVEIKCEQLEEFSNATSFNLFNYLYNIVNEIRLKIA